MNRCKKCGAPQRTDDMQQAKIRSFLMHYPWVQQRHLGHLLNLSASRISEIINYRKELK